MKKLISLLVVFLVSFGVFAQDSGVKTLGRLSAIAEEDLANTISDLNKMREEIATEKIPLAEKLSALEDKLVSLRKQQTEVARGLDDVNLQNVNLKTEMKARKDELAYVGNLLDEYAKTFETRVHPCELQTLGNPINSAKEAPTNPTLSMAEKYEKQTQLVNVSIKRLFDVVGGMTFSGEAVDLQSNVLPGKFAIVGPVALFKANNGEAGLVVQQSNSNRPLVRTISEVSPALQAGIVNIIANGEGNLPLDPTRGAALKALVQKTNLIHIFKKGGPIMWPLLVGSILALAVVMERAIFLLVERLRRNPRLAANFLQAVAEGKTPQALKMAEKSKDYVVRSLAYAMQHDEESLENALRYSQAREMARYRRGIAILDTLIPLSQLLGLLGTVTGMMGSFSMVGGELSNPGAITGGIAEALIATAFGMGISITCLVPFNYINSKAEKAQHEMESAGSQLQLLLAGTPDDPASKGPENPKPHGGSHTVEVTLSPMVTRRGAAIAACAGGIDKE